MNNKQQCSVFMVSIIFFLVFMHFCADAAGSQTSQTGFKGVVSGICFEDSNRDGLHDKAEAGMPGAAVSLVKMLLGLIPVSVAATETDPAGLYEFSGLSPGVYRLECLVSEDPEKTTENPSVIFLGIFDRTAEVDFGYVPQTVPDTFTSTTTSVAAELPLPATSSSTTSSSMSTTTTTTVSGGGSGSGGESSTSTTTISTTTTSITAEPPLPATNLIAAGSDKKVGLAWTNPDNDRWQGTVIIRDTDNYPEQPGDGVPVYDGRDSDWVDKNLNNGTTYYYTAFAYSAGRVFADPPDNASYYITPQMIEESAWLDNSTDWKNQPDPFADEVFMYEPAMNPDVVPFGSSNLPDVVLGPPSGGGQLGGSMDVLSLGARANDDNATSTPYGGFIILKFTDNIIVNADGPDFTVFENPFSYSSGGMSGRFMEPAVVSVSQDGVRFYQIPCDFIPLEAQNPEMADIIEHCSNPDNYISGFAGLNPVMSLYQTDNETMETYYDPTDPTVSGGDTFDLDDLVDVSLRWIQYVKIQYTGDSWLRDSDGELIRHNPFAGATSGFSESGFDLDAVSAVNY